MSVKTHLATAELGLRVILTTEGGLRVDFFWFANVIDNEEEELEEDVDDWMLAVGVVPVIPFLVE